MNRQRRVILAFPLRNLVTYLNFSIRIYPEHHFQMKWNIGFFILRCVYYNLLYICFSIETLQHLDQLQTTCKSDPLFYFALQIIKLMNL